MKQRMKVPYEKGVAICSASSLALGIALKSQLPNDLRRRKAAYPAGAEGESKEILGAGTQP